MKAVRLVRYLRLVFIFQVNAVGVERIIYRITETHFEEHQLRRGSLLRLPCTLCGAHSAMRLTGVALFAVCFATSVAQSSRRYLPSGKTRSLL